MITIRVFQTLKNRVRFQDTVETTCQEYTKLQKDGVQGLKETDLEKRPVSSYKSDSYPTRPHGPSIKRFILGVRCFPSLTLCL